jgi:hypothetical protein
MDGLSELWLGNKLVGKVRYRDLEKVGKKWFFRDGDGAVVATYREDEFDRVEDAKR